MHCFFSNLSTVPGNNNTIYSENGIDNRNVHSKLPIIVFQINSISLIEPEEFSKTSMDLTHVSQKPEYKDVCRRNSTTHSYL